MLEKNKIYNMDCIEGMKQIKTGTIDMILTDLPYGTTRNKWDTIIPFEPLWEQYKRIIKDNGAIVLFAQTPFDKVLGSSNLDMLRYEWIWEKDRASGHLNAKKMPMKSHENILVFYKRLPTYNPQKTTGHKPANTSGKRRKETSNYGKFDNVISGGQTDRYPRSVLKFNVVNSQHNQIHPTQKPIEICEYMIRTYSNEGDLILDSCIGSGTTIIACKKNKRRYLGFELDKQYYDLANERIEKYNVCEVVNKGSHKASNSV